MAHESGATVLSTLAAIDFGQILHESTTFAGQLSAGLGIPKLDRAIESCAVVSSQILLELTSHASSNGSAFLTYYLLARAILPPRYNGAKSCVIYIDAEERFDVQRLVRQLEKIISQECQRSEPASRPLPPGHVQSLINTALEHVFVYRPQSLSAMISTLESIPDYLFAFHRHHSADRCVGYIMLDSPTTFLWQTRADAELAEAPPATTRSTPNRVRLLTHSRIVSQLYHDLGQSLATAQTKLGCKILINTPTFQRPFPSYTSDTTTATHSNNTALPASVDSDRPSFEIAQILRGYTSSSISHPPSTSCSNSQHKLHVTLDVERGSVCKFPAGFSIEEAKRDAANRQKAVAAAGFRCRISKGLLVAKEDVRPKRREEEVHLTEFGFDVDDQGLLFRNEDEYDR